MTPFSGERLASFLAWSILRNQPIHALMWAGFAGGLIVSLKQGWRSSPVPIYLLLNAASLAWLGKAGSSLLYFYEFGLAGALGLGWALASLERRSAQRAALATLAIAALAAAGLPSTTREPFAGKNAESERRVVDAVKQARGPLLLEDPGYAALANRTDVEMVNPFLATQLFARRLADPTPLIAAVRAGRFGLIVLASPVGRPSQTTRDRYPAAMLAAIAQSYELHDAFGENFLYAPRTGPNAEAVSGPK
jgi:hypothetical protein